MGNVHSQVDKPLGITYEVTAPPSRPVLDMDNMPFMRPPTGAIHFRESSALEENDFGNRSQQHLHVYQEDYTTQSISSLEVSPVLPPPPSRSPLSPQTQWKAGHAKWPSYHEAEGSSTLKQWGEIAAASPQVINRSPSSSQSGSSITSQLSFLSQSCASSPQKHRNRMSMQHYSGSLEFVDEPVDANVPPPVPPHTVLPLHRRKQNQEVESALAVIDSLQDEVEDDENTFRSRPRNRSVSQPQSRSRSRARSLSRPRSISRSYSSSSCLISDMDSTGNDFVLTTDIYTRRCVRPESSPPGLTKSEQSDTESEDPGSPDHSFVLDGYSEGSTTLRVVNSENRNNDMSTSSTRNDHERLRSEKELAQLYRVKSKALLAEEEEMRQRKRYARYGHTFRGVSAYRA